MVVYLLPGVSGDSPHDGCWEGKCRDCEETDQAWSQCQSHQQGELMFKLCIVELVRIIATGPGTAYPLRWWDLCLHRHWSCGFPDIFFAAILTFLIPRVLLTYVRVISSFWASWAYKSPVKPAYIILVLLVELLARLGGHGISSYVVALTIVCSSHSCNKVFLDSVQ